MGNHQRGDMQMNRKKVLACLLVLVLFILGCSMTQATPNVIEPSPTLQPTQFVTVEVTRLVEETQIVTVEVTRIVRETEIVIVEAPPVIQIVTPTPQPENLLQAENTLTVAQGINLLVPRIMHTSTRLSDDRVLVVGGSRGPDQHLPYVEVFDPVTGSINWATSLHTPRHGHTATLLNDGRVLVIGGYSLPQQWLSDAEVYNPSTDTWTVVPPLYSHGVAHSATLLDDGRVLVVGGCIGSGVCTDRVETFDPLSNTWTEVASMPLDHSLQVAILLDTGMVLVAGGGSIIDTSQDNQAFLFDPQLNQWKSAGLMIEPRNLAQAVKLIDGRILVAAGYYSKNSSQPEPMKSCEIYDPVSNSWSQVAYLNVARYGFLMNSLPDGRAVVIGGARNWEYFWTSQSFIGEIEVYDPSVNQWILFGEIPNPTTDAAASLLPDGSIWISGGRSGTTDDTYWAQTWLIH
jgi:N-acetylneuraminic acid mutarotase